METVELLQCGKTSCQHVLLKEEQVWVQEDEISRRATFPKCGNDAFYILTAQGMPRMQGDTSPREIKPEDIEPSQRMGPKRRGAVLAARKRAFDPMDKLNQPKS